VPTLVLEGNRPIFGSQVILQYLDSIAPEDKRILPPTSDTTRYDELVLESLADALLDAALLYRYEITGRVSSSALSSWACTRKQS
jgi:glutathione S-transferase